MLTASVERYIMRELPGEPEPIGVRLRRLRVERGLSQRELAGPGVSYAYISRIEAGTRRPSVKALRTLARKLGVSADYLETGSDIRDVDARELRLADAELQLRIGGDPETARQAYEALLVESRNEGDAVSAARAEMGLGLVAADVGDHERATALLQNAVDSGTVSPLDRVDVFATLARSYSLIGAHDRAISVLESCLEYAAENDPENVTAYVRYSGTLSAALTDLGDLGRAESVLADALERAGDAADVYTRIRLYWSVARLSEREGRSSRALLYVRKAIALLEASEDTVDLARAHLLCAWIMVGDNRAADALPHLETCERLFGSTADRTDLAMLRVEQAKAAAQLGRGPDAVLRAREALELLGDAAHGESGNAWWALAEGLALEDDVPAAVDAFARAVDMLDAAADWRDAAHACRRWAKVLRDAGRDADALDALERATDYAVRTQPTSHTSIG